MVGDAEAAPLRAKLTELLTIPPGEITGKSVSTTSIWKRNHERRSTSALGAADWLRSGCLNLRERRPVDLLLIEPEGILKKQCNVSLIDDASLAQGKRRRSLFGAYRFDAFYTACVPFLRALLIHLPPDGDDYDATSGYGSGPGKHELRSDAPSIAFVTNLGHLTSKLRPGEEKLVGEATVRHVMYKLLKRVASELGVETAVLAKKVSLFISYCAPGETAERRVAASGAEATPSGAAAVEPTEEKARAALAADAFASSWTMAPEDAWSATWAKPQPGMLHAAMAHHGVEPSNCLMIGYDFVDQEAASRAGIDYVDQQHLIGVESFDACFDEEAMCDKQRTHLVPPGTARGVKAPGSFATDAKRQANTEKRKRGDAEGMRSPTK